LIDIYFVDIYFIAVQVLNELLSIPFQYFSIIRFN